jgi:23S rRNA pseudouridine955/2504/2580 synthase
MSYLQLDSTEILPLAQNTVMREIILPHAEPAKKLENFLKKQFPIGYVRKVFRKNGVRINGRRAKPNDLLHAGDRIQLYIPFEANAVKPKPGSGARQLDVIFEDDSLLVINKPAGLAVHESKTDRKRDSVLGVLEIQYRDAGMRPQLVHRIDKDTSGLLIVAKTSKAAGELKSAFETGEVDKQYLCLVVGRLPTQEGKIDFPLPGREGTMVSALTRYRVVKRFADTTLVRVAIETGRLHQIRLHFAKLGYPIVMDDQHGDFAFNKKFRKVYGLKRQFLHADKLTIAYADKTGGWTVPLSKDLNQTLLQLAAPTI